jgi:hypothetical protein
LRAYVQVPRTNGAAAPFIASFFGALPIGMLSLSVLLLVRLDLGSLADAGVATGFLTAGNAAGVLAQGRASTGTGSRRSSSRPAWPASPHCSDCWLPPPTTPQSSSLCWPSPLG